MIDADTQRGNIQRSNDEKSLANQESWVKTYRKLGD